MKFFFRKKHFLNRVKLCRLLLAISGAWLTGYTVAGSSDPQIIVSVEKIGSETDTDNLQILENPIVLSSVNAALWDTDRCTGNVTFCTGDLFKLGIDNQTDYPILSYIYMGGAMKNYVIVQAKKKWAIERPSDSPKYFKIVNKDDVITTEEQIHESAQNSSADYGNQSFLNIMIVLQIFRIHPDFLSGQAFPQPVTDLLSKIKRALFQQPMFEPLSEIQNLSFYTKKPAGLTVFGSSYATVAEKSKKKGGIENEIGTALSEAASKQTFKSQTLESLAEKEENNFRMLFNAPCTAYVVFMVNKAQNREEASSSATGADWQHWRNNTLLDQAGLLGILKEREKSEFKRYQDVIKKHPLTKRIVRVAEK